MLPVPESKCKLASSESQRIERHALFLGGHIQLGGEAQSELGDVAGCELTLSLQAALEVIDGEFLSENFTGA